MLPPRDIVKEGLRAPPNSPKLGVTVLPGNCLVYHFNNSEIEDRLSDVLLDTKPMSPPSCPRFDDCERFPDNKWDDIEEEILIEDIEEKYIQEVDVSFLEQTNSHVKPKGFLRRQNRCTDLAGWAKAAMQEKEDMEIDNKFSPASESPSSVFDFNDSSSDNDSEVGSKKTSTSNGTGSPRRRVKFFL